MKKIYIYIEVYIFVKILVHEYDDFKHKTLQQHDLQELVTTVGNKFLYLRF